MYNRLTKMVPLVSFLAALRILTEAQSCNNGLGKLVYEKVADYRLSGVTRFGNNKAIKEVISRSELPIKILEECIRRCQEDRVTAIQHCLSFDFTPGKRRSSPFQSQPKINSNTPLRDSLTSDISAEYEQSSCTLYNERGNPDGEDTLVKQENSWHFNEVCLSSTKVSTQCSNRLYIFERIPSYKFEGSDDKEVNAINRTECEDKCLNEHTFPCRSASFDRKTTKCKLSKETRYMNPKSFKMDPNSDYMENMCLSRAQMCAWTAFILETGKELDGPYERVLISTRDFQQCSNHCLESLEKQGFLCRSFMFDEAGHTCILYDEDPLSHEEMAQSEGAHTQLSQFKSRPLKPSPGNLYRVVCMNSERDTSVTTLECYRRMRLNGSHQIEIEAYSFFDCLKECMKRFSRFCRSVEYSSFKRKCRFSSYDRNRKGKINLINDSFFDFYQFLWHRVPYGSQHPIGHGHGHGHGQGYGHSHGHSHGHSPGHSPGLYPPDQHISRSGYAGYGSESSSASSAQDSSYGSSYQQNDRWSNSYSSHARDHHRGGFGYNEYGGSPGEQGGYSISRSGYSGYGSRYPGYGIPPYGSHSQHVSSHATYHGGVHSQTPLSQPPLSHGLSYGIPYSHGFSGAHNSIAAPYPPQQIPEVKCKTSALGVPVSSRFTRMGFGARLRSQYVFKVVRAERIEDCERSCTETRDFQCKSFNFRGFFPDNCELSHLDSKQFKIDNPSYFEQNTQYDYYERSDSSGVSPSPSDCLEVTQTCTPEGMEFTLKTPEGFYGRIYTYGFYDSCFYDGNGGSSSVLRISRANGFPRCGTQQYGDAMTNIVVVQFNDYVQTSRDKKYNLTCYFSGPGEAVVTSNYLDTKTDGRYPTQIEHLPAQNILTSNVVLRVLYRGTPTNTIVVGDLLTFRLEARGQYRYDYFNSDIFATNVIAKDPYTGRQVHLIDSRGCPVDLYVFPELHKTPDGGLEAEFYAFKIPDSNFLVFQATVRTCRGPCEPVICTDRGRGPGSFPSWGRKKRAAVKKEIIEKRDTKEEEEEDTDVKVATNSSDNDPEEEVHELLRVYLSREDVPADSKSSTVMTKSTPRVCVPQSSYYALITTLTILISLMTIAGVGAGIYMFRRTKVSLLKEVDIIPSHHANRNAGNFYTSQTHSPAHSHQKFDDPSEPIYIDPSLFERSRSLRSVTVSNIGKTQSLQFPDD